MLGPAATPTGHRGLTTGYEGSPSDVDDEQSAGNPAQYIISPRRMSIGIPQSTFGAVHSSSEVTRDVAVVGGGEESGKHAPSTAAGSSFSTRAKHYAAPARRPSAVNDLLPVGFVARPVGHIDSGMDRPKSSQLTSRTPLSSRLLQATQQVVSEAAVPTEPDSVAKRDLASFFATYHYGPSAENCKAPVAPKSTASVIAPRSSTAPVLPLPRNLPAGREPEHPAPNASTCVFMEQLTKQQDAMEAAEDIMAEVPIGSLHDCSKPTQVMGAAEAAAGKRNESFGGNVARVRQRLAALRSLGRVVLSWDDNDEAMASKSVVDTKVCPSLEESA